jgi:Flp pilus assembly secretin CpaC
MAVAAGSSLYRPWVRSAAADTLIRIPPGGYRTIEPTRPFDQIINRNPELITIEENKSNHSFRIRSLAAGESNVELHSTDGRGRPMVRSFRVVAQPKEQSSSFGLQYKSYQNAAGSSSGDISAIIQKTFKRITSTAIADQMILSGELTSVSEFHALERLVAHSVAKIVPQFAITPELLDQILTDVNRRLKGGSGVTLALVRSGSGIIATTDDPSNKAVIRLISRYAMIIPGFDADRSGNPYPESQIKVTMHFVESTTNNASETGQKFSGAHFPLTGEISSGRIEQAPFQYYLRYLSSHLATRVLEQPSVMAQSGTTSELHSGGDLAYQTATSSKTTSTQFRNYGLTARVTPRTRHDGDIRIDLDLEISEPSGAATNATNQTMNSRKVKSSLILQDGMARLAARLRRQKKENSSAAPPLIAEIPVLSWLVSSNGRQSELQDLWIFVSATSDLYQPFEGQDETLSKLMGDK